MQLEAGPIPAITSDWYDPTIENPNFTDLVNTELSLLPVLEILLDLNFDPVLPPDVLPDDGGIPPLLDAADAALVNSAFDDGAYTSLVDAEIAPVNEALLNAYSTVPGEAWQPVPAPLDVPGAAVGPAVYLPGSGFSIKNLTRPGATDFFSGEQYELDVNVPQVGAGFPAGTQLPIQINQERDGAFLTLIDLGVTDSFGYMICSGTFQDADVGQWTLIAGFVSPANGEWIPIGNVQFAVQPAVVPYGGLVTSQIVLGPGLHPTCTTGGQPAQGAVAVNLVNNTTGDATNFHVGDQWTLTVNGDPGQDVLIRATQDGNDLPWVVLGQTDATGTFVLPGQMDTPHLGAWVEYYQVGVVAWSGNLTFTVAP